MTTVASLAAIISVHAITAGEIRFHNIDSDTTRINNVLERHLSDRNKGNGQLIAVIASEFINTPYEGGTLEGTPERLTINMEKLDCTTFVETVLAMAMSIKEGRTSWRDFATHLQQLRYRNGAVDGYGSRLHYISDWIVDNTHKGLIEEATARVATPGYKIKTLDFMSRNSNLYEALGDSANLAFIKHIEQGYRSHRYPFIKPRNAKDARLATGDIIFFLTNKDGLDVSHAGIIKMVDGEPHLLHASSRSKRVVLEDSPLATYLHRNGSIAGFRIIRLRD